MDNQLVFTKEEIMKLEIIDEFLEKGFELPDDPFQMQLFPQVDTSSMDFESTNKQNVTEEAFV